MPELPVSQYVEALVDCPGNQQVYCYRIPEELSIAPGDVLSVPFGPQQVGAIALRIMDRPPEDIPTQKIKPIENIASTSLFPPGYWALLERVATYYHTSLMATIRAVLPSGLLRRSQRRIKLTGTLSETDLAELNPTAQQIYQLLHLSKTQDYTWTYIKQKIKGAQTGLRQLQAHQRVSVYFQTKATAKPKTKRVVTLIATDFGLATPRQQEILSFLQRRGGELWLKDLLGYTHASASTVQTLEQKGWVVICDRETLRFESSVTETDQARELTVDQANALAQINAHHDFRSILLHGVTGSGKTEVYLQAIAPILALGQSVLLLVPEIGLTPQISDRVRARFGERVRVYHSALSDGERYDTWRSLLDAEPQIVIGTRSAIFAPLHNLGLIILDEEHDNGYKQESPVPCYHARTIAQWRAEQANCPLILGTATPSLETWVSVQNNGQHLQLPQRVLGQAMPPIELIDMREELQRGNRSVFSLKLQSRLMAMRSKGQQGLLFINRRGHSTFVSCRSCGYVVECPNCSVSLTYHQTHPKAQPVLRCHYCNHTELQPQKCPSCDSPYFKFFGSGTQRVMEELRDNLPDLRVLRFDSDTTRRKGAHRELLTRFAQGEADVMVGTQMLTKGIDIPLVQFVGVLAADSLLNLSDFRASERTFQTLLQVAGRTGRGDRPGEVFIQTYNPDNPVLEAVRDYRLESFTSNELAMREALQYPPFGQLILLKLSSPNESLVEKTADKITQALDEILEVVYDDYSILGPAPAQILKVARRFRWHILLKLPRNTAAEPLKHLIPVDYLRSLCPSDVRFGIDVDPLHFA